MLTRTSFRERFGTPALIGMVHLAPLPGAPLWGGSLDIVVERALADATALAEAGFDALIVENFGDRPFSKSAGPETVAAMTAVIGRITRAVELPVGVNVLRNDPRAAIAIASATSSSFIRVNVHVGTMATDQGLIEGAAADTLRYRRSLEADVAIFADLLVKHAKPVVEVDAVEAVLELRERGLADAILLTGTATGRPVDARLLKEVREALDAPLIVASGVSEENIADLGRMADGFIIGTSIKENGVSDAPVDRQRARHIAGLLK